ncbi:hypothetical protein D3C73_1126840 [compost metagenome]
MGFDGIGEFEQQQRAVFRRGMRPAVERSVGGAHGGIDLGFAGFVDFHQHTTQRRVEHRLGGAFAALQLAVDQEFGLHGVVLFGTVVFSRWKPALIVGAGLLAKAVCQAPSLLNVMASSRASPLPH